MCSESVVQTVRNINRTSRILTEVVQKLIRHANRLMRLAINTGGFSSSTDIEQLPPCASKCVTWMAFVLLFESRHDQSCIQSGGCGEPNFLASSSITRKPAGHGLRPSRVEWFWLQPRLLLPCSISKYCLCFGFEVPQNDQAEALGRSVISRYSVLFPNTQL